MKEVKLQKYPAYKDSGVKWLGEIPEHWEVTKLGRLGVFTASGIDKYVKRGESLVKIINFTDVYGNKNRVLDNNIDYMVVSTPEKNKLRHLVNKGDLIFLPSSETYEDLGVSALVSEHLENTSFSYHVIRFQFYNEFNLAYKKYIANNRFVLEQFSKHGKGTTRKIIGRNVFKNIFVVVPTLLEQTTIANFLDNKTALIAKAIALKEKQIELLKERRQILIHRAVTRGLNPDVKFKDSGVEWIGGIPEHWEVKSAKYLFDEINERSQTGNEELLSVSHMTGVTPRSEKNVTMFQAEDYTGSKLCRKYDLVYNIMWAWMGALGVAYQTGIVSPSYAIYRQKNPDTFNPYYLELLLKDVNYVAHYNRISKGLHSSRLRFYSDMFFEMKIGFPTKEEQNLIVTYLDKIISKLDTAIVLKEKEIEKLKEYKSVLINEAVSGKIKITL